LFGKNQQWVGGKTVINMEKIMDKALYGLVIAASILGAALIVRQLLIVFEQGLPWFLQG